MALNLQGKGLRIAHLNICSLRNKIDDLSVLVHDNNIHILALSETHLDASVTSSEIDITGYCVHRLDRDCRGGGVGIYVQNHIPVKMRYDLMQNSLESIWLQVHLPFTKPLLIGCCYRPPNSNVQHVENICDQLLRVMDEEKETFFLGDLNIDWLSKTCPLKRRLLVVVNACNLSQLVNLPTRVSCNISGSASSTCIDHIYTNSKELCPKTYSIPVGFSDHNIVAIIRKTKLTKAGPRILFQRSYKSFNETAFINDIKELSWERIYATHNTDIALELFNEMVLKVINEHAPLRKFTAKRKSAPWFDDELKTSMTQRDNFKALAVQTKDPVDWVNYKTSRNRVTKLNRLKKKTYFENKLLEHKNNGRKLWATCNSILGRHKPNSPSCIEEKGVYLTKPSEVANYFNNFFIDKVSGLRSKMKLCEEDMRNTVLIKERIMNGKNCTLALKAVSINEVKELLKSVKSDTQFGLDNIDGRMVKIMAEYIALPVCHILNCSIREGVFPHAWRVAKVIPIIKDSKSAFNGSNCRPISILPVLSKILERIIFDQILTYFTKNGLDSKHQHAYKAGHSTATALAHMTDDWLGHIDNKKIVGAVLIDFSSAFDVIDHKLLLSKLCAYGFNANATNWLKSYLFSRRQCVYFNGHFSAVKHLECGIPQGSCLGPLLFSIFTNDLPLALNEASMTMYADDSTVYAASNSHSELNILLQHELDLVIEWVDRNRLSLNIAKTKCIALGSHATVKRQNTLTLSIKHTAIEQVYKVKLLGLNIDEKLSWSNHIDDVAMRMGRAVSVINRCSYYMNDHTIKLVIQALVLSHIDYCSIVWSSAPKSVIQKLQFVQNRAARLVLGCPYRANVKYMHSRLQWLTVENRLFYNLLTFFHKMYVFQKPICLFSRIQHVHDTHNHNTRRRSKGLVVLPPARTCAKQKTVMYRAMLSWNRLSDEVRSIVSIPAFKKQLKRTRLEAQD